MSARYAGLLRGVESFGQCAAFGVNSSRFNLTYTVCWRLRFRILNSMVPDADVPSCRSSSSSSFGQFRSRLPSSPSSRSASPRGTGDLPQPSQAMSRSGVRRPATTPAISRMRSGRARKTRSRPRFEVALALVRVRRSSTGVLLFSLELGASIQLCNHVYKPLLICRPGLGPVSFP